MMEAVIILASIARRFQLRRDLSRPVVPVPLISIRPQGGLPVTVHRQEGAGRGTEDRKRGA